MVRSNKFMGLVNIQYWWKSSTGQMSLAEDDAYRLHLNEYSPDDRLARSYDIGRQQFPSEEAAPLASVSHRKL